MHKLLSCVSIFVMLSSKLFAQSYTPKADMPFAKIGFATSAVNGKIYVCGGASGGSITNTVHEYDVSTNTWTAKANMPQATYETFAGTVNGKIYVIGGYNGSAMSTVQEYNPATNTWTTKAPMPTPRATISGAVVNNKIYITGGWLGEYKELEIYDPATNTWSTGTDCPLGFLQNNGGAALGSYFYTICGRNYNYTTYYDDNLRYNTTNNTWTAMASMPAALFGGSTAVLNGKIHFFGGASKNNPPSTSTGLYHPNHNSHYIYNPVTDSWTTGLALPAKRSAHGSVEVNGKIYIIGGYDSSGLGGDSKKVWEYAEPAPVCGTPVDTISNITQNSALIKWNTVTGSLGYQYSVVTNPTPPVNGTATTNTQYPAASLAPNTKYYVHLRSICANDTSAWAIDSFTTLPVPVLCNAPVDTISDITDSSALITWNNVTEAIGYEFWVNRSNVPPATAVKTTATYYKATALLPNTKFYVHLKTICSSGESAWALDSFTTEPLSIYQLTTKEKIVTAYPNPVTDVLFVKHNTNTNNYNGEITIIDINGTVISKQSLQATETKIDMRSFANGIYFLRYTDESRSQVLKLIKQ